MLVKLNNIKLPTKCMFVGWLYKWMLNCLNFPEYKWEILKLQKQNVNFSVL